MNKKSPKNKPVIELWDDFNEIDLSKKKLFPDSWYDYHHSQRLPQSEVIERFKSVHGKKYDYSKVKVVNSTTKVKIICPLHGEFFQNPREHMGGQGCPVCARETKHNNMRKPYSNIIADFQKYHGKKYDYSKVKYVNSTTKVKIICPIHGDFEQIPNDHMKGIGCKKCGILTIQKKNKENNFNKKIKELINYYKIHKEIPNSRKGNLGLWCSIRKKLYHRKELEDWEVIKLNEISFWTWGKKNKRGLK